MLNLLELDITFGGVDIEKSKWKFFEIISKRNALKWRGIGRTKQKKRTKTKQRKTNQTKL